MKGSSADIESFHASLKKAIDATGNNIERYIKQLNFAIIAEITLLTPVKTGRAKGGWNPGPDNQVIETKTKTSYQIVTTNRVHYVIYLEYGKSQQNPQGMVRMTLAKYKNMIKDKK